MVITIPIKEEEGLISSSAQNSILAVFEKNGIIAYPTETFYGLGVNPFNETAIKNLFKLKERTADKPISILIKDKNMLFQVADEISPKAELLMNRFWPGPLTIIFKAKNIIPSNLTGGTGKIGVRISSNPVAQILLSVIDAPITTTSANPSGKKSPVTANEVKDYFGNKIDLILDGGIISGKLGSTIVDMTEDKPLVIRAGDIPVKAVFDIIK